MFLCAPATDCGTLVSWPGRHLTVKVHQCRKQLYSPLVGDVTTQSRTPHLRTVGIKQEQILRNLKIAPGESTHVDKSDFLAQLSQGRRVDDL